MFNNNSVRSKSEQIAEQVFEPVQIPVVIGNELYVVTQQDVRNIIETRYLSCIKCPNMAPRGPQFPSQTIPQPNLPYNIDFLNVAANLLQWYCANNSQTAGPGTQQGVCQMVGQGLNPHELLKTQNTVAPIATQLDWEMKAGHSEKPSQFTYCKRTSTSDLKDFTRRRRTGLRNYNPRRILKILISKGTNTCSGKIIDELEKQQEELDDDCEMQPTAKEQLKQKKELCQL